MADVKRYWNMTPIDANNWKLIVNFWSFETFYANVFVSLKISNGGYGFVTVKSRASEHDRDADPVIIIEFDNVPVSASKLDELKNIFQETRYWAFPPGGRNSPCIDGWGYLLETTRGDDVRSWINLCSVSPEMERIGRYMLRLTPHAYQ